MGGWQVRAGQWHGSREGRTNRGVSDTQPQVNRTSAQAWLEVVSSVVTSVQAGLGGRSLELSWKGELGHVDRAGLAGYQDFSVVRDA